MKAIDEEQQRKSNEMRILNQMVIRGFGSGKEYKEISDKNRSKEVPLPKYVQTKIRLCRDSAAKIQRLGFKAFQFSDLPKCYCFIKPHNSVDDPADGTVSENFVYEACRATLRSHQCAIWHAGHGPVLPDLGWLYLVSKVPLTSGFEAFLTRVKAKNRELKKAARKPRNITAEMAIKMKAKSRRRKVREQVKHSLEMDRKMRIGGAEAVQFLEEEEERLHQENQRPTSPKKRDPSKLPVVELNTTKKVSFHRSSYAAAWLTSNEWEGIMMSTPVTALPATTATDSLDDRPRSRRSHHRHTQKSHSSLPTLEQNPVTPVQQEHETTDRSTGPKPKARRTLFARLMRVR
eukprot:g5147.t1